MKQKDKNILIAIIFVIIFILIWTVTKYTSIKKESDVIKQEIEQLEKDSQKTSETFQELEDIKEATIKTITPLNLQQKIFSSDDLLVIDTRSKDDFTKGHIKGSIHITAIDNQDIAKTIVLISNSGDESSMIDLYRDLPSSSIIYNLSGGILAWEKEHFNLIKSTIEKSFENQSKISLVEPRDLNALLENEEELKNIFIIDTRRSGNYEKEHVPNSINIPFDDLEMLSNDIPSTKKVYIYGADEDTSFESSVLLYDLGISGAKTINGGFKAWKEYGYSTEK
ncbi:MAG: rhodanese-like domain-containing protein [Candidatus Moraniibacteriota bacterium]|jgi:hydroxyacylglutathione hydrolase